VASYLHGRFPDATKSKHLAGHPRPCEQKFKGDTLTFCKQIEDWLNELKKKEDESLAQITRDMNTVKGLIPGKISLRIKRAFLALGILRLAFLD
jgi:hypothetical protein